MVRDGPSEDEERLEAVLFEYLLAREEGRVLDLSELCRGESELLTAVQELVERERALFHPELEPEPGQLPQGAPSELGPFRLLRLLGRGGMGSVYLAEQAAPRRLVALKLLDGTPFLEEQARLRFKREADLAASLDHPSIIEVFAVGHDAGVDYLAMKWLPGPALSELELPLSPAETARLGARLAGALDLAHRSGVVHRDVKPSNILFDAYDRPVLVDFGLARTPGDHSLTRTGQAPGTLPYMAPELLSASHAPVDPRLDVYSLGATMFELVSGAPPFGTGDSAALAARITSQDPGPLNLRGRDRDLEAILFRALEKEPRRRIQTANHLADELERYLDQRPVRSRRVSAVERWLRRARRHGRQIAAAGTLLLVAASLGTWALASRMREERLLARTLEAAQGQLAAGDPARALELLEPLADRSEALGLIEDCRAERAYRNLLNEVVNRRSAILANDLLAKIEQVLTTGAARREPLYARLALALGYWHLEDRARASSILEQITNRDTDALAFDTVRALVESTPWPRARPTRADGMALAFAAMWLAGRPIEELSAFVEEGLRLHPDSSRLLYAHAMVLSTSGEHEPAIQVLRELQRRSPTERGVLRNLARELLRTWDLSGALELLSSIPEAERTPIEAQLELNCLLNGGDLMRFDERLSAYSSDLERGRWERADEIRLVQAVASMARPEAGEDGVRRGFEILEEVGRDGESYVNRDQAQAMIYAARVERGLQGADLSDLEARGRALTEQLSYPPARARVRWKLGMTLFAAGKPKDAIRAIEQALDEVPDLRHAAAELVNALLAYADYRRTADPEEAAFFETLAWRRSRILLVSGQEFDAMGRPSRTFYLELAAQASRRVNDWTGLEEALEALCRLTLDASERQSFGNELRLLREKLAAAR